MNMFEADQVQFCEASDSWQLTPDGRLAYPDLLAADLASVETADLAPSYEKFLAINSSFQDLRGEWRLREGDFNDHIDATYDENVIDRLAALDAAAQPVVVVLSGVLEHKVLHHKFDIHNTTRIAFEIKVFAIAHHGAVLCAHFLPHPADR